MVTSDGEKTCDTGRRSSFPPFWLVELRTNDAVNRHVGPRCDVFSSSIFFSSEISNVDMSPHLPLSLSLSLSLFTEFFHVIYRVLALTSTGLRRWAWPAPYLRTWYANEMQIGERRCETGTSVSGKFKWSIIWKKRKSKRAGGTALHRSPYLHTKPHHWDWPRYDLMILPLFFFLPSFTGFF